MKYFSLNQAEANSRALEETEMALRRAREEAERKRKLFNEMCPLSTEELGRVLLRVHKEENHSGYFYKPDPS